MKVSKEMKEVIKESFESEPGMLVGFLEVENDVEIEGWHPDFCKAGVTLVVYKGYNDEVQCEILAEMYENAKKHSRPDEL